MKKRPIIIITILLVLGITSYLYMRENIFGHYRVSISNKTNIPLENLDLILNEGTRLSSIQSLKPNEKWKFSLDTRDTEEENSMVLKYKDFEGLIRQDFVIGYFEDGYGGSVQVIISDINDQGVLTLEVEEK